jgi:hypothetical protein
MFDNRMSFIIAIEWINLSELPESLAKLAREPCVWFSMSTSLNAEFASAVFSGVTASL